MAKGILVTGGAGFIGAQFINELLEDQNNTYDNIVVLDKLTYAGDKDRFGKNLEKIHFYQGDICDKKLVMEIMKAYSIEHIVNFAAESHVDKSIEDVSSFIHTNVLGVQSLVDVAMAHWKDHDFDQKKFIQVSTDEVYGSSSEQGQDYFDEQSGLNPKNPYAATKASGELLLGTMVNTHGFPAMITRSSNNYGPGQNEEKFIPSILKALANHQVITIYGDGRHQRTWIHVRDHCRGILQVLSQGEIGEVYNISSGQMLTNKDLATRLIEAYNRRTNKAYTLELTYVEDRKGHDFAYRINTNKIKDKLGFACKTDLDHGLDQLVIEISGQEK